MILASIVLGACGFSPMYGNLNTNARTAVEAKLAQIDIARIPEREGQILRNKLVERLYGGTNKTIRTYTLHVAPIREKRTELDITEDADTTRAQLRLSTTMRLKRAGKEETMLTRDITATTSFNVLASQFTTRVSEQNARQNAIQTLAERIERQLALYFQRKAKARRET
jgi:LPS-assembly lipoprotein